ncbi:acyl-CoA dehydrogenase family protein [Chloroflexota bacterium]
MDFALTEEQKMLQNMVREFTKNEVEPIADEIDKSEEFPHELMKRFKEMDLFGLPYPSEYGGNSMGYLAYVLAVEQLAQASSVVAGWLGSQCNCMEPIFLFGTEEQKKKYLIPLAQGEMLGSIAFSEPSTGSDPGAIETTARLVGDEYVLNGQKRFITRATVNQVEFTFAKTEDGRISAFIVDAHTPGYSVGPPWDKMGSHGSDTCDIYLDNVRVPKENMVGEQGQGYAILLRAITSGKLGWAAQGIGMTQRAMEEAIKYAKERIVRGRPQAELLNTQELLADMATSVEAIRLLTYKAAWLRDQGDDALKAVAMAKLFSADASVDAISKAMEVHGAYGYISDFKVERLLRDATLNKVIEGTVQIQRVIIANHLLREYGG